MLKYLILIFGLATIILSSYQLITSDDQLTPYTQLIMGTMLAVMGIEEFRRQRKILGYFLIFTALFVLVVQILVL